MAIMSSFLCWSNTRTGSAVCGYYTLVISVVCLAFYMLRYIALDQMKDSIELKGIVYAGFVLYSFLIGVSLILLPGVYMDRKFLLLPWIYVLVITVLYETGAIALITTVHLEQDHTLDAWEIAAIAFYCVRLIVNCYCFACVVSQYQELSEGRGTYEFLFKPRRRNMARGAPLTDLEEYNPPYGASLPPYSEENPYKEYSPPTYENLALEYEDFEALGRTRGGTHSSYLADVIVNPPPAGYDADSESYNEYDRSSPYSAVHHHYTSSDELSEANHDRSSSSPQSDLSTGSLSSEHRHHHHHHCHHHHHHSRHHRHSNNHHRNNLNNQPNDGAIAMTSSSAYLMEFNSNCNTSLDHRSQKPARSKRAPMSPLTVQKRTYITWI